MKKLCILALCLFLSACLGGRSQKPYVYSLDAVPVSKTNTSFSQSVALTHIRLPKHLDRPQIVVFDADDSRMIVSEKNRWVEPLPNLMERVLVMDLSKALPNAIVKQRTLANEMFDTILSVDIVDLKTVLDDKITIEGWWVLRSFDGKIIKREKLSASVPVSDEYEDIGKSLSRLVSVVAVKIAQKL